MDMTVEMILLSVLILLTVVGLVVFILRSRNTSPGQDVVAALSGIHDELLGRNTVIDTKVSELSSKLASLQETVTSREATLDEQVRGIGTQMKGIAGLFSNDRARGGWGEISMLRVFELGGLTEGRDFTAQQRTEVGTPDAVVHLPGGRKLVVDCKFPVARFNEALVCAEPEERNRLLAAQGKELEAAGRTLVERGYHRLAAGGYVVMYVPSQAVYEATAEVSHDVLERLMERRVVVAGPTALFALIMVASALLTEHRALEQADEILDEVRELYRRLGTFIAHLAAIGTSLGKAVSVFNQAVGSWSVRVAPQLDKIDELGGHDTASELEPVEEVLRSIEPAAYILPVPTSRN
jgi:DNA recombination protein RmuC